MKVLELIEELEELIDQSTGFPLTGKLLVDGAEILEITKEIKEELPDEIQQAQWLVNDRKRILGEAQSEYDGLLSEAKKKADAIINEDHLIIKAREKAEDLIRHAEQTSTEIKLETFEYTENILSRFQEKLEQLHSVYFGEMYSSLEKSFENMNTIVSNNKEEIREMIYKLQTENYE